MTYGELKLASLQKMFHDLKVLEENEVTKPYLDKMVYVTNCAITRACLVGEGIHKRCEIFRDNYRNLVKDCEKYHKLTAVCSDDGEVSIFAEAGRSFFVKTRGTGKIEIYVSGNKVNEKIFSSEKEEEYRHMIQNPGNNEVRVVFKTDSNMFFSYPAIYREQFEGDKIPENNSMIFYDFSILNDDFYKFDSNNNVIQQCDEEGVLYGFSDEKTFFVNGFSGGKWSVPYIAYPNVITEETPDDTEIKLPYELCLILPFYIASELYLEDDSGLSIGWRNKFESSLSEYSVLKKRKPMQKYEVVESAGGIYGAI